jgi:hypothetical protein
MKFNSKFKIFHLIGAIVLISGFGIYQSKLDSTKIIIEHIGRESSQFQDVINAAVLPNIKALKEISFIAFFLLAGLFYKFIHTEYFNKNKNI